VAVDAFGLDGGCVDAGMRGQGGVAGLAVPGEEREGVAPGAMGIVAGHAVECRVLKAFAAVEQLILITVNVHFAGIVVANGFREIIAGEMVAGAEAKQGELFGVDARMTDCASIEALLALEGVDPGDEPRHEFFGMAGVPVDVLGGGAVAALAIDAV